MEYRYLTCDVFTRERFGGNPLAVLPDAQGLDGQQMQRIAREFNYSETAFVLPPEQGHTRRVRIFTPTREVPFAGHPNVGTAFCLASSGAFGDIDKGTTVCFEELAGLVHITIDRDADGGLRCELAAPASLELGQQVPAELIAKAVSLDVNAVKTTAHQPCVASVGLPFVFAELADRSALEKAQYDIAGLKGIADLGIEPDLYVYCAGDEGFDIRARMFAPFDGVPEDPATGSANCAMAGLLCSLLPDADADPSWRVAQGVEMGRPSELNVRASRRDGKVTGTWVGGYSVPVASGTIRV
ncbi:MAG: PhzF family phenazine biosynthesis protein [Pseudomonadota bacterium]